MMRQQTWSLRALEHVQAVRSRPEEQQRKYKTLCMKMPGMVQRSGLIQALVFVQAREKMGAEFCDDLAEIYGAESGNKLRGSVQSAELEEYLAMSRDLLEVSAWMRRMAQIELADIEMDDSGS